METVQLIIGIILIVFAVFLVIAVLMQEGKSHNLSGSIAGGADTFFGKSKGQTINKTLSTVTSIVAVVFVLLVCAVYVMQNTGNIADNGGFWNSLVGNGTKVEETAKDEETTAVDTAAEETKAETTVADAE